MNAHLHRLSDAAALLLSAHFFRLLEGEVQNSIINNLQCVFSPSRADAASLSQLFSLLYFFFIML